MGRPIKIAKSSTIDTGLPMSDVAPFIGVVAGDTGITGEQFKVQANIEYATGQYDNGDAYIIRQKGKQKFMVANAADVSHTQVCVVVNKDDAADLEAGEMNLIAQDSSGGDVVLARIKNRSALAYNGQTYWLSSVTANANTQPGSTNEGYYSVLKIIGD